MSAAGVIQSESRQVADLKVVGSSPAGRAISLSLAPLPAAFVADRLSAGRVPDGASPTTLYRFFDDVGVLLYVGISAFGPVRWLGHEAREWWPRVSRVTTEHFEDRLAAAIAERAAIEREGPLHNIVYAARRPEPTAPVHRRHGTGSISPRQDGRWRASLMADGRRREWTVRDRVDAELILAALQAGKASDAARRIAVDLLGAGSFAGTP